MAAHTPADGESYSYGHEPPPAACGGFLCASADAGGGRRLGHGLGVLRGRVDCGDAVALPRSKSREVDWLGGVPADGGRLLLHAPLAVGRERVHQGCGVPGRDPCLRRCRVHVWGPGAIDGRGPLPGVQGRANEREPRPLAQCTRDVAERALLLAPVDPIRGRPCSYRRSLAGGPDYRQASARGSVRALRLRPPRPRRRRAVPRVRHGPHQVIPSAPPLRSSAPLR
jgi:hypothetical protein